jgi:hypothetical protein
LKRIRLNNSKLSYKSPTTSTITFRISKKYEDYLRTKTKLDNVSVNVAANKIFREYIEWQQFVEKFGTIVLSKEAFDMLIEAIDENKLIDLGIKIGQKTPKEFILFRWKKITDKNVIEFIKMFSNHCLNAQHDYILSNLNSYISYFQENQLFRHNKHILL